MFGTAIKNFQSAERDITLAVEERAAILRNYVPGDAGNYTLKSMCCISSYYFHIFGVFNCILFYISRPWRDS